MLYFLLSQNCQLELSKWNVIANNQRAFNQNIYNIYIYIYLYMLYILTTKLNSSTLSALSRSFSLSLSPTLNIIYQLFCVLFITLTFHTHSHTHILTRKSTSNTQTHTYANEHHSTHTHSHTHTLSSIDSPILIMLHIFFWCVSTHFFVSIPNCFIYETLLQSIDLHNQSKNPQTTTTTTKKLSKIYNSSTRWSSILNFSTKNYRTIVYYLYSLYKRFVSFHSVPFCYDVSSRLP